MKENQLNTTNENTVTIAKNRKQLQPFQNMKHSQIKYQSSFKCRYKNKFLLRYLKPHEIRKTKNKHQVTLNRIDIIRITVLEKKQKTDIYERKTYKNK